MREHDDRHFPDAGNIPLTVIKTMHTIVWAFFAGCILAIPVAAWLTAYQVAAWFAITVFIEVLILALNRFWCSLTSLAAPYTGDRRENLDIYLPRWLASSNKAVFGSLYIAGTAFAIIQWLQTSG